mgnify:FL=1
MEEPKVVLTDTDRAFFLEMIEAGKIKYSYTEDENGEGNSFLFHKDLENITDDTFLDKLNSYISEAYYIASMGGFEAPSEYYRSIKEFIETTEKEGGLGL